MEHKIYHDSELLMISGLQHLLFCERQWALIHLEQIWDENIFTASGNIFHEKVHSGQNEQRGDKRIVRSLKLVSYELGLIGQSDVVEFHLCLDGKTGIRLQGKTGLWKPFPVEYKSGNPKTDQSDDVQLCAQAVCLEEMLGVDIEEGAIFYGRQRRRKTIEFNTFLRELTRSTANKIHDIFSKGKTPPAEYLPKCNSCSLFDLCLPKKTEKGNSVSSYLSGRLKEFL